MSASHNWFGSLLTDKAHKYKPEPPLSEISSDAHLSPLLPLNAASNDLVADVRCRNTCGPLTHPKEVASDVLRLDSTIHRINLYPMDSTIFLNINPLDRVLSGGQRYPTCKQLGPGVKNQLFFRLRAFTTNWKIADVYGYFKQC